MLICPRLIMFLFPLSYFLFWYIQERKEKEARAAEGGWTVVVHHKGRKKTTDSETGIAVGSVSQTAVMDNMAKKKKNDVGLDFYRFQKREAKRNGMFTASLLLSTTSCSILFKIDFVFLDYPIEKYFIKGKSLNQKFDVIQTITFKFEVKKYLHFLMKRLWFLSLNWRCILLGLYCLSIASLHSQKKRKNY